MCGIVGIVRNDGKPVDEQLLARMNDAIRHRGPDEDGFYVNGPAGLAMRRLAIIDLKCGQQPIHNSGSQLVDRLQRRDLQLSRTARETRKTGPHVLYQQRH